MRLSTSPVLWGLAGSSAVCASALARRQAGSLDSCPGYAASNVKDEGARLTADLSLAGTACNAYSEDLTTLKLEVEYQTGGLSGLGRSMEMQLLTSAQRIACMSRFTMRMSRCIRCPRACFPGLTARAARRATRRWRSSGPRRRSRSRSSERARTRRCSILRRRVWSSRASICECGPVCPTRRIYMAWANTRIPSS